MNHILHLYKEKNQKCQENQEHHHHQKYQENHDWEDQEHHHHQKYQENHQWKDQEHHHRYHQQKHHHGYQKHQEHQKHQKHQLRNGCCFRKGSVEGSTNPVLDIYLTVSSWGQSFVNCWHVSLIQDQSTENDPSCCCCWDILWAYCFLNGIHPGKLTWIPRIAMFERKYIFQGPSFVVSSR